MSVRVLYGITSVKMFIRILVENRYGKLGFERMRETESYE